MRFISEVERRKRLEDLMLYGGVSGRPSTILAAPAIGSSMTLASLGMAASGVCTVLVSATITTLGTGSIQNVIGIDDGTLSNQFFVRHPTSGATLTVGRSFGGASTASMGNISNGVAFKAGMAIPGAGVARGSLNGAAAAGVTAGPTSGLTTLRVGNNSAGSATMGGSVAKVQIFPGFAATDAELQAMVAAFA